MTRRRKIYEGKAKILYEGPEPGTLIQYFKDDATAFNAQKKGTIAGKGVSRDEYRKSVNITDKEVWNYTRRYEATDSASTMVSLKL